ncbi:hypothetical protein PHLGIDRAFT_361898 [Phlebiopsis gigantea 11061_1 CR5-6]|uniref:Uncharacterized protein n=1 Tax=Phlebiopsis gigantea (strain 11061_1 CR5-6) TaxID=745531 RepID=A0A0C3SCI1_PHLG1|nr:hypothetical protein PHLGIDRAFT_361898 [Phlebiopsis gigantea 11061_1 CR5-6]
MTFGLEVKSAAKLDQQRSSLSIKCFCVVLGPLILSILKDYSRSHNSLWRIRPWILASMSL